MAEPKVSADIQPPRWGGGALTVTVRVAQEDTEATWVFVHEEGGRGWQVTDPPWSLSIWQEPTPVGFEEVAAMYFPQDVVREIMRQLDAQTASYGRSTEGPT